MKTTERILEEKPEWVTLTVAEGSSAGTYEEMNVMISNGRIHFSCQPWACVALEELDNGKLRCRVEWDTETPEGEGQIFDAEVSWTDEATARHRNT